MRSYPRITLELNGTIAILTLGLHSILLDTIRNETMKMPGKKMMSKYMSKAKSAGKKMKHSMGAASKKAKSLGKKVKRSVKATKKIMRGK
jgi:hypothetical protein